MTASRHVSVLAGLTFVGTVFLVPSLAGAHAFAPSLLEIHEDAPVPKTVQETVRATVQATVRATVRWKQPAVRAAGSELRPVLPPTCRPATEPGVVREETGVVVTWTVECAEPFAGRTLGVEGLAVSRTDVLLRVVLADGRTVRHVLTADRPSYTVPEDDGSLDVLAAYGSVGVEHILTGFDHLLFVFGLVLLVRGGRRLLWTVTAFTAGHSITLALAILGFVAIPPRPIEAAIALSIYLLAVELAPASRPSRGADATRKPTLMKRLPWLMAGLFGLLHGLGFAGALSEVGLPSGEIPTALVSFNLGIEAGQLAFVAVVLLSWAVLRRLSLRWPPWAAAVPSYVIGSLAAYWFLERLLVALG